MASKFDHVSYALAYLRTGYQAPEGGKFNPIDVCLYYLCAHPTRDWHNVAVALSLVDNPTVVMFGHHSWNDGSHLDWAHKLAMTQSLSMQMLYDRHGHPILAEHPVLTNQEITNTLGPQLSLIIDVNQGDPTAPGGVWRQMLDGGNVNAWFLEEQWDEAYNPPGWPGTNPRIPEVARTRGKKKGWDKR